MKQSKFNKLRTEFLPEALEIVEQPTAPLGSIIIWLVFILLLSFILWACFGKMDEVVTARGQVLADEGIQEVQSAGTGIITEIKVNEGDHVSKGDVLFTMDKEIEKKGIDYSEGEIGLLQLKIDLLTKMINGGNLYAYRKADYSDEQNQVIDSMIELDRTNKLAIEEGEIAVEVAKNKLNSNEQSVDSNRDKTDYLKQKKDIQDEIKDYSSTAELELMQLLEKQKDASEEVEKYKRLCEAGAKPRVELEQREKALEDINSQIEIKKVEIENEGIKLSNDKLQRLEESENIDYQLEESENEANNIKYSEIDSRNNYEAAIKNLESLKSQQLDKLYEMKQQYIDELKKYDVQIAEQYSQYDNKDIVALYDGVVKTLHVDKAGSVVSTTQVVAEIIPDSNALIIEAEVKNSDIAHVEVGQNVDVKIDTYNYQKYGKLSGEVLYISPDATENKMMEKVYNVKVMINSDASSKIDVSQGMECTVEIKTDKKRIIEFFLEPLTDALEKGFK